MATTSVESGANLPPTPSSDAVRRPPPAPKPGRIRAFRALRDYEATQPSELTFHEGDTLYVSETSENVAGAFYRAMCNGRHGLVPVAYLESESEQVAHPLHEAARRGNLAAAQECLANGVSVNGLDKSGATPLFWAAHGGHLDLVKMLLDQKNANVSARNKMGETALHAAAYKSRPAIVRLLLEQHASAHDKNRDGKRPSELATDPEVRALLLGAEKADSLNEAEPNEYESGSENEDQG